MAKRTTSIKGEVVDFDLLDIKSKMEKTDKPLDVKTREDFVHMKRRRRGAVNMVALAESRNKNKQKQNASSPVQEAAPSLKDDTSDAANTQNADATIKTASKTTSKRKIVKKD